MKCYGVRCGRNIFFAFLWLVFSSACNPYKSTVNSPGLTSNSSTQNPANSNPTIPIKLPSTRPTDPDEGGGGGGGTADRAIFAKGMVRSLTAVEFPTNRNRADLSGTVAKLELEWRKKKIDQKYTVHIRRWGPFPDGEEMPLLLKSFEDKFKCPTLTSELANELKYDQIEVSVNQINPTSTLSDYAKKYTVETLHAANGNTFRFLPLTVAHFEDDKRLPILKIPPAFEYDGDRNLDGLPSRAQMFVVNNGANADQLNRRELMLLPDTFYVYKYCVGYAKAAEWVWEIDSMKVFRPMDLEKPQSPPPLRATESHLARTRCFDAGTNASLVRRADIKINVKLPAVATGLYDQSIGRTPMGRLDASDIVELRYITKRIGDGTYFKDEPLGNTLSNSNANAQVGRAVMIDNTIGTVVKTPNQLLTDLLTTGSAQFHFQTNTHFVNGINNQEPPPAPFNSLVKDYLGGTIPKSRTFNEPSVRLAFELLIKDRSIPSSKNFASVVFGQDPTKLIFEGLEALPKMTGGIFFRGETRNSILLNAATPSTAAIYQDGHIYNDEANNNNAIGTCDN